jgi:2-dehydropantoate 2-reductase
METPQKEGLLFSLVDYFPGPPLSWGSHGGGVVKITVYGAGAIGGLAGGYAALAGEDVTLVDKVPQHVNRINEGGLLITGLRGDHRIKVKAIEPKQLRGELGLVLLCVKSQDTVSAMETMLPHIGPASTVVSLQNGLNEEVIARYIGAERTVGCLVDWGGDYQGLGHIQHGSEGPMRMGELDGAITSRLSRIQKVLNHTAPTTLTTNIFGYLWSKLIWGDFYVGNALGTSTVVSMLANRQYHPILLGLFQEGVAVARAAGITLEPLPEHCFDPVTLVQTDLEESHAAFERMAQSFSGHLKVYSGPWRDIAVRKRPTEVDHILGPIISKGKELGVPTPLNSQLVGLVKEVESGRRPQDDANLLELEALF